MQIGIIGTGRIGSTLAGLFARGGHDVEIGTRRDPEKLGDLTADLGARVSVHAIDAAARFGDVVAVAIPFGAIGELPRDAFAGKIVVDANNYYPDRDGHVAELDADETTSSEMLASRLAGATVVKAFNTMYYATLASAGEPEAAPDERLAIYLAGDDPAAKRVVSDLIEQIGFTAVDTGTLAQGGRLQQPGSPIYGKDVSAAQARATVGRLTE
jgi:predicted dinucleotide-binding enzyme